MLLLCTCKMKKNKIKTLEVPPWALINIHSSSRSNKNKFGKFKIFFSFLSSHCSHALDVTLFLRVRIFTLNFARCIRTLDTLNCQLWVVLWILARSIHFGDKYGSVKYKRSRFFKVSSSARRLLYSRIKAWDHRRFSHWVLNRASCTLIYSETANAPCFHPPCFIILGEKPASLSVWGYIIMALEQKEDNFESFLEIKFYNNTIV